MDFINSQEEFFTNLENEKNQSSYLQEQKDNFTVLCMNFLSELEHSSLTCRFSRTSEDSEDGSSYRVSFGKRHDSDSLSMKTLGRVSLRLNSDANLRVYILVEKKEAELLGTLGFNNGRVINGFRHMWIDLSEKIEPSNALSKILNKLTVLESFQNGLFSEWLTQDLINLLSGKKNERVGNIDLSLDPKQKLVPKLITTKKYPRDPILIKEIKKLAQYKCELNPDHETFEDKDGNPYVEVHHFVPLSFQDEYIWCGQSLDIIENLMCLCPNCHAKFHHSSKDTTLELLEDLYESKIEKIATAGLKITFERLKEAYGLGEVYGVEILAQFELGLDYQFSQDELRDAENVIADAFDTLESEIQGEFDSIMGGDISIEFIAKSRRRKDNIYKLTGSFSQCFEFKEKDIDGGELVDGVFDSQLKSMEICLKNRIEQASYDLTITDFSWADDEVIE